MRVEEPYQNSTVPTKKFYARQVLVSGCVKDDVRLLSQAQIRCALESARWNLTQAVPAIDEVGLLPYAE
eukprot:2336959-Amphidinium_carterae.1